RMHAVEPPTAISSAPATPPTSFTGAGLPIVLQQPTCPLLRRAHVRNASGSVASSTASSMPSIRRRSPPSWQYTSPFVVHAHVIGWLVTTPATFAMPATSVGVSGYVRPQHCSFAPLVRTQAYPKPTEIVLRVGAALAGATDTASTTTTRTSF